MNDLTKVFVMPCSTIFARSDAIKAEHIRTCAYCGSIAANVEGREKPSIVSGLDTSSREVLTSAFTAPQPMHEGTDR